MGIEATISGKHGWSTVGEGMRQVERFVSYKDTLRGLVPESNGCDSQSPLVAYKVLCNPIPPTLFEMAANCLEKFMDRRAWRATVTKSKRLSDFHFPFLYLFDLTYCSPLPYSVSKHTDFLILQTHQVPCLGPLH